MSEVSDARIAELEREVASLRKMLADSKSAYAERIEHQAATTDVLQAMSASAGDPQPVFELIADRARDICDSYGASVFEFDGTLLYLRAWNGVSDDLKIREAYVARFPSQPTRESAAGRAILDRQVIHIKDYLSEGDLRLMPGNTTVRSNVTVPMMRGDDVIGAVQLGSREVAGFSDAQVELLKTFAEQAVIAITSAETYRALQERTEALAQRNSAFGERISQQAAIIDVLKAMSASPGDTQPVFDLIAHRAAELCESRCGLWRFQDGQMQMAAHYGIEPSVLATFTRHYPRPPDRSSVTGRAVLERNMVHVRDVAGDPALSQALRGLGGNAAVAIPLLRDAECMGAIALNGRHEGGFSDSQIALLQTFAEQAVIAITSAETYHSLKVHTDALAARNSEYSERIEHQSATIDVLQAMSASPDDPQPVFDLIVEHATRIANGLGTALFEYKGKLVHFRAEYGGAIMNQEALEEYKKRFPMPPTRGSVSCRSILERRIIAVPDIDADPELDQFVRDLSARSQLSVPMLRDGEAIGAISMNCRPGEFSDAQVRLLQTFAEQAVIAITSAETYRALQERTAQLTHSVAELHALEEMMRAVNSSLDLDTVLATIINRAVHLSDADEGTIYEFDHSEQVFVPKAAFGMTAERVEALRDRKVRLGETHLGRSALSRQPVYVEDVQRDPALRDSGDILRGIHAILTVPLLREDRVVGGLVIRRRREESFVPTTVTLMQTFAAQCVLAIENARLFQEAGRARTTAETTLADLRRAQDRLVQSEKMASLGQLTAGIAHEIKNPLNFVNNFSDLSRDLLDELRDAVAANHAAEIDELTDTLKANLEKIAQHGRRADSIVKNMLLHSRSGPSEYRPIDLNATVEEALNLAYHGARAETPGFNITMTKQFDPNAGLVELYPQEFIRVMVNLINNGFYAARKRASEPGFEPVLSVATRNLGKQVEVRVRDNGTGISDAVRDHIFDPFFTTKPAGEGTGLGLSLGYDIVVKQHGGQLTVDSRINDFTEFTITLPREMATAGENA